MPPVREPPFEVEQRVVGAAHAAAEVEHLRAALGRAVGGGVEQELERRPPVELRRGPREVVLRDAAAPEEDAGAGRLALAFTVLDLGTRAVAQEGEIERMVPTITRKGC